MWSRGSWSGKKRVFSCGSQGQKGPIPRWDRSQVHTLKPDAGAGLSDSSEETRLCPLPWLHNKFTQNSGMKQPFILLLGSGAQGSGQSAVGRGCKRPALRFKAERLWRVCSPERTLFSSRYRVFVELAWSPACFPHSDKLPPPASYLRLCV